MSFLRTSYCSPNHRQLEVYTGRIGTIVGTLESVRIIGVSARWGSIVLTTLYMNINEPSMNINEPWIVSTSLRSTISAPLGGSSFQSLTVTVLMFIHYVMYLLFLFFIIVLSLSICEQI